MKTLSVSFTPDPAVTDPADVVTKYRYQASVAGAVIAPVKEFGVSEVSTLDIDSGVSGVDVDFDYAFADAAGNWTADQRKTLHVEPDKVPDVTPPPPDAGSLTVEVVPAPEPAPAPTPDPAPVAPVDPAPVAPVAPAPVDPGVAPA